MGRVGRPHGTRGAFTVSDPSDRPEVFVPGRRLLIGEHELEVLGHYNPQTEPSTIVIDEQKLRGWIEKGAQPTGTVKKLMKAKGISA